MNTPVTMDELGFNVSLNKIVEVKCNYDFALNAVVKHLISDGKYLTLDNIYAIYGFGSCFKEPKYKEVVIPGWKFLWWSKPDQVKQNLIKPKDIDLIVVLKDKKNLPKNIQFCPYYAQKIVPAYDCCVWAVVKDNKYHIMVIDKSNFKSLDEDDTAFIEKIQPEAVLLAGKPVKQLINDNIVDIQIYDFINREGQVARFDSKNIPIA